MYGHKDMTIIKIKLFVNIVNNVAQFTAYLVSCAVCPAAKFVWIIGCL